MRSRHEFDRRVVMASLSSSQNGCDYNLHVIKVLLAVNSFVYLIIGFYLLGNRSQVSNRDKPKNHAKSPVFTQTMFLSLHRDFFPDIHVQTECCEMSEKLVRSCSHLKKQNKKCQHLVPVVQNLLFESTRSPSLKVPESHMHMIWI